MTQKTTARTTTKRKVRKAAKPRGRPKVYEREVALETAMQMFWNAGYEGVSVADLCETLGVTPPTLYSAFGNKEKLFREAVEHYAVTRTAFVREAVTQEPTARAAMARILRECATRYANGDNPRGCLIGSGVLRSAHDNKDVARFLTARRTASREALIGRLKLAIKAGEIDSATDIKALARFYATVVQGMSVQAIDGASTAELTRIADMAMALWPASGGR